MSELIKKKKKKVLCEELTLQYTQTLKKLILHAIGLLNTSYLHIFLLENLLCTSDVFISVTGLSKKLS